MNMPETDKQPAMFSDKTIAMPERFADVIWLIHKLALDHLYCHWRKLILSFVIMIVLSGLNIAIASIMGSVTADLFDDQSSISPYILGVMIIIAFAGRGFFRFAAFIVADSLTRRIELDMRHRLFKAMIYLDMTLFDQSHDGFLLNRYINISKSGAILLVQISQHRLREVIITLSLIGYMFYLDWTGTLAVLVLLPPSIWAVAYLAKKVRLIARDTLCLVDAQITHMREVIHGIKTVRANRAEDKVEKEAETNRMLINNLARRNQFMSNILKPINETSAGLAIAAVIVYGSFQVNIGVSTGTEVMKFIFALLMATEPMMRLARETVNFSQLGVDVAAFYQITDIKRGDDKAPSLPPSALENPVIVFDHLSFHYKNTEKAALSDVSFTAAPGELTAIVGPSGAGKSTVFNLILRFYQPETGQITLGGTPIENYNRASLRDGIAYLPQNPFMFADTIRNNIMIGCPDADDQAVIEAAKKARAYDFIMALPNGFDTQLQSSSNRLSGGQMQRISIARAFLRQAKIVLLDEPTTGLDNETAVSIKEAISQLTKTGSVLVIAHHFDTIKTADKVVLLNKGCVKLVGSPDELIENSEDFRRLFQISRANHSPA